MDSAHAQTHAITYRDMKRALSAMTEENLARSAQRPRLMGLALEAMTSMHPHQTR
jgi:hypothetical protein